jgi:hypothetical protein
MLFIIQCGNEVIPKNQSSTKQLCFGERLNYEAIPDGKTNPAITSSSQNLIQCQWSIMTSILS